MNRHETLVELLKRIEAVTPEQPTLVAIDGFDGAGKTVLAHELAELASAAGGRHVINVSIDGFPITHAPGYSFPSGHAFSITLMLTTSLIMLWPTLRHSGTRAVLIAASTATIILTALDRVLLGVHFPTDVVAGILLALAVAVGSYIGCAALLGHDPGGDPDNAPEVGQPVSS